MPKAIKNFFSSLFRSDPSKDKPNLEPKSNVDRFAKVICNPDTAILPGRLNANKIAFKPDTEPKVEVDKKNSFFLSIAQLWKAIKTPHQSPNQKLDSNSFAIAAQFPKPDQLEDHLQALFNMDGGVTAVLASTKDMEDSIKGKDTKALSDLRTQEVLGKVDAYDNFDDGSADTDKVPSLDTDGEPWKALGISKRDYKGAAMINYFSGFDSKTFGRFEVSSEMVSGDAIVQGKGKEDMHLKTYKLTIKDTQSNKESSVTLLHVDKWPDFGAPTAGALKTIVDEITSKNESKHPPLVHCIAGVGRTGLVAGALALKKAKDTGREMDYQDVIEIIRAARNDQMLETLTQINVLREFQYNIGLEDLYEERWIGASDDRVKDSSDIGDAALEGVQALFKP